MKQFLWAIAFLFYQGILVAQPSKLLNLRRFDHKKSHFGIQLGVNSAGFALHRKAGSFLTDSLSAIHVVEQQGFHLAIVTALHLHKYLHLRFIPGYLSTQRNIDFQFVDSRGTTRIVSKPVESNYIELPFLLQYRSERLNNFAAYFIAGYKYSIDFSSNEDVKNENISESIIKLKRHTSAVEVGLGTDFFLPYSKLSLELKMSYGLQDALIHDNTELSAPIEKIVPKMFLLSFLIEG